MSLGMQLLLLPLLIAANAFFVAAEYAIVSIRRPQIYALEQRGYTRSARFLARLRGKMSSTLGGIQVCITMTNLMLGWLGEPAMARVLDLVLRPVWRAIPERWESPIATAISFVCVTLATVVLSELLPKALTLQHTLLIGRLVALPLRLILWCIHPLVWLMDRLANGASWLLGLGPVRIEDPPMGVDELRAVAQEAGDQGTLGAQERALIVNTLGLSGMRADDVMVPRVRVAYLDLRKTMTQNREVMEERLYSRLPLCNGGMDHVIGLIYTKEFLAAYPETDESSVLQLLARPVVFAPATVPLDRLLALFLEKHSRMIVLVDEYGGVEGIVTLTDVMDRLLKGEAS